MNNFDLKNKIAIVTGGAQGFGLDIAKKFINSGSKVRIWDNDENELNKVIKKENNENLKYDVVDVTDFDSVNKTVKNLKNSKIDILINNAGITGPTAELWNYSFDDWNKVINVNLNGTYICCKLIVPLMIKNNYGRIVNIASVSGKDGNANASAYSSAKAGVLGLTKSLGKELAYNIILQLMQLLPAGAKTRILNQMTKEHVQRMLSKVPRGRFLELMNYLHLFVGYHQKRTLFQPLQFLILVVEDLLIRFLFRVNYFISIFALFVSYHWC